LKVNRSANGGSSALSGTSGTTAASAPPASATSRAMAPDLRPMTSTIALEMGEAVQGGPHYHALFTLALMLLVITLGFNLLAERIRKRDFS